ncbi:hypothetical protein H4219_003105 [Mycoemilia scoparia]|uniref:RING-type domain-containing protein n=1 Tax=Mycoemilia scoparia TaxID=417184 RepID=A0A9W8DT64_9FUNG|nr:hypothetical protein H4219_003105 [Mycoemilia scoparia]
MDSSRINSNINIRNSPSIHKNEHINKQRNKESTPQEFTKWKSQAPAVSTTPSANSRHGPQNKNKYSGKAAPRSDQRQAAGKNDDSSNSAGRSRSKKSKEKQSLNHLLNFKLPPRLSVTSIEPRRVHGNNVSGGSYYKPYDKNAFVNANFRFVLKYGCDLEQYLTNSDAKVDWNDVEQVIIPSHEATICPICLSPPIAARVTTCGHIYCYTCLLRYASISRSKSKWHKCPVCQSDINSDEFRPVRLWQIRYIDKATIGNPVNNGNSKKPIANSERQAITMRLVRRPRDSLLALPRNNPFWRTYSEKPIEFPKGVDRIPWTFDAWIFAFSRFTIASSGYMANEAKREIDELEADLEANKNDADGAIYINSAINELQAMATSLDPDGTASICDAQKANEKKLKRMLNEAMASGDSGSKDNIATDPNTRYTNDTSSTEDDSYFFYQSDDGQHIYLQPLDTKVLKENYGSYLSMPDEITVTIQHITETTMDHQVRKRFQFLRHIPCRCDLSFIEVDLEQVISKAIYEKYYDVIQKRIKQHAEKAKREAIHHKRVAALNEIKAKQFILEKYGKTGFGGGHSPEDYNVTNHLSQLISAGLIDAGNIDSIDNPEILSALDNVDNFFASTSADFAPQPEFTSFSDFPELSSHESSAQDLTALKPGVSSAIPASNPIWPKDGGASTNNNGQSNLGWFNLGGDSWDIDDDNFDIEVDNGKPKSRKRNQKNKRILVNSGPRRRY